LPERNDAAANSPAAPAPIIITDIISELYANSDMYTMGRTLTEKDLKTAVSGIREQYERLIREFGKPRRVLEAFEDRYLFALKNRRDLFMFFRAETEAVEQLRAKELEKPVVSVTAARRETAGPGFVDKVFEQNRQCIIKYPCVELCAESDDEIGRLLGAVRAYINGYFPVLVYIYRDRRYTPEWQALSSCYDRLLSRYGVSGEVPLAKAYEAALSLRPRDLKRADQERRFLMQETAFLLNELLSTIGRIIRAEAVPSPDSLFVFRTGDEKLVKLFNGQPFREGVRKNYEYLKNLIEDFRIKDFVRK
jgi:hypothetical protein